MWYKWSFGTLLVTGENNQASNEVIQKIPSQNLTDSDISCRALFYANLLLGKDDLEKIELDHGYKILLKFLYQSLTNFFL